MVTLFPTLRVLAWAILRTLPIWSVSVLWRLQEKRKVFRPSSKISGASKSVVLVTLSKVAGGCAEHDSIISGGQLLGYLQVWDCWTSCETVLSVKMAGANYHVDEESSQGLDA